MLLQQREKKNYRSPGGHIQISVSVKGLCLLIPEQLHIGCINPIKSNM
jgi:hypothetical protein